MLTFTKEQLATALDIEHEGKTYVLIVNDTGIKVRIIKSDGNCAVIDVDDAPIEARDLLDELRLRPSVANTP